MREPAPAAYGATGHLPVGDASSEAHTQDASATSLNAKWLRPVQIAWLALTALSVVLFAVGLPVYVATLHTVCTGALCPSMQLSPAAAQVLGRFGLSLNTYAALMTIDTLLIVLILFTVGGVIAWRRSDDWLALLVAYLLLTLGSTLVTGSLAVPNSAWRFAENLASFLGAGLALFLVFYLFPDGRFTPRWLGWVILVGVGVEAGNTLFQGSALDVDHWVPNLENLCFFGILAAVAGAQIYRYRRLYSPIQRQQSKWLIFSIAVFAVFGLGVYVLVPLLGRSAGNAEALPSIIVPLIFANVLALLFPLSIAIAIFRYRLWDIDVIINRTLVYGSLTALLAGVYFGSVIGLQALAQAVTGQRKPQSVAIVASTLLSAALFEPLRRWLQAAIDRRFYRRKYDIGRTIAAFGTSLQSETDLTQLSEQLVAVAQETMQPAHAWLWLRPPRRAEERQIQELWRHVPADIAALGASGEAPLTEPFAGSP